MQSGFSLEKKGIENGKDCFSPWTGTDRCLDISQASRRRVCGWRSGLESNTDASDEQQPWSYVSLARLKAAYEDGGFNLQVIESRPPMEKIKLGLPGRDEEIDVICEFIRNMGHWGFQCGALRGCRFFLSSEHPSQSLHVAGLRSAAMTTIT